MQLSLVESLGECGVPYVDFTCRLCACYLSHRVNTLGTEILCLLKASLPLIAIFISVVIGHCFPFEDRPG